MNCHNLIDDHLQHQGADVVIVPDEAKDQPVSIIELGAVQLAMPGTGQLPDLRGAKIAAGNGGGDLEVGSLHPRYIEAG